MRNIGLIAHTRIYMIIIRQFQEKFNSRITDIIIFTQGIIMTNHEQLFEINGVVENIIYRNEENGYTVLEISGDEALITANGVIPLVNAGESVKLFGVFKNHPTYGEQFAVSAFERTMPENMDGILKYLSSGAIKGIGPSTARRLVLEFGADTLSVLENDPERVAKLKGISLKKAQDISEQLKSVVGIRELMIYLANYSVTPNAAVKIWKKYGNNAIAQIEENYSAVGMTYNDNDNSIIPAEWNGDYYPFYIPEEFMLTHIDELFNIIHFTAMDDRVLQFGEYENAIYTNIDIDEENAFDITINGNSGIAMTDRESTTIAWCVEDTYLYLYFSGDLEAAKLIASNVKRVRDI